jgi:hypothetical protein
VRVWRACARRPASAIDRDEDLDLKELFRLEDHVLDEP